MVGSLKKGSKQSMSLPSTAYNTLPAHVHQMRSSPRVISGSNKKSSQYHKRSPSSDSGTGSNTPVSSYHSGKVHHTVYLHGKSMIWLTDSCPLENSSKSGKSTNNRKYFEILTNQSVFLIKVFT